MLLNSTMVYSQLSQYFDIEYAQCSQNITARRPIFYNAFFRMDGHVVVLKSKDMLQSVDRMKGCILICLDKPEGEFRSDANDIIVVNDPISDKIIFTILMYIFDRFEEWDSRLHEIVYKSMGFQELLDACWLVMAEPVSLMDSNFKYVAYTSTPEIYSQFVDEMERLPLEDVNTLTSMPDFGQLEAKKEAFIYVAGEAVVYKNIFHDGSYVGRLSVLVDDDEEAEYCKAVFDHLAGYIETLYAQCHGFEIAPPRLADLHLMLKKCLHHEVVDTGELRGLLEANNSCPGDSFSMLRFCSNTLKGKAHNMDYLCVQLERMWPGAYCITYEEGIAVLINQTRFSSHSGKEFQKELAYFLRESLLLAGISRDFTDISLIYSAYAQAQAALSLGMAKRPTLWYHYFDRYALDYLVEQGQGSFLPEQVCSRELLKLIDYDRRNGTSYYETLHTYAKLQYNAVASAKALYIHRSSFINRMERIRELVDLDLEDLDSRLYLLLSFHILEGHKG